MTEEQALALPRWARITVRKPGRKQTRKALVLRQPERVGRFVVVDYALIRRGDWDTISPANHVAVIGQDVVVAVR